MPIQDQSSAVSPETRPVRRWPTIETRESVFNKTGYDSQEKYDLHGGEGVEPGDQLGSPLPVHRQKTKSAQGLCQVLRNHQVLLKQPLIYLQFSVQVVHRPDV